MKWYPALWVGPRAAKKKWKILSAMKQKKRFPNVWVITLAANSSELLDILPLNFLYHGISPTEEWCILGIALGKQEALELVETIVDTLYQETGSVQLREFYIPFFQET